MHAELVVVGLGYVGLPVLIEASSSGVRCVGLDSDADKVAALSAGRSHIDDISDDQVAQSAGGRCVVHHRRVVSRRHRRHGDLCADTTR